MTRTEVWTKKLEMLLLPSFSLNPKHFRTIKSEQQIRVTAHRTFIEHYSFVFEYPRMKMRPFFGHIFKWNIEIKNILKWIIGIIVFFIQSFISKRSDFDVSFQNVPDLLVHFKMLPKKVSLSFLGIHLNTAKSSKWNKWWISLNLFVQVDEYREFLNVTGCMHWNLSKYHEIAVKYAWTNEYFAYFFFIPMKPTLHFSNLKFLWHKLLTNNSQ